MSSENLEPEILVNISFRLPAMAAMDRQTFADQMKPLIHEVLMVGGSSMHFSTQPYDPDED